MKIKMHYLLFILLLPITVVFGDTTNKKVTSLIDFTVKINKKTVKEQCLDSSFNTVFHIKEAGIEITKSFVFLTIYMAYVIKDDVIPALREVFLNGNIIELLNSSFLIEPTVNLEILAYAENVIRSKVISEKDTEYILSLLQEEMPDYLVSKETLIVDLTFYLQKRLGII